MLKFVSPQTSTYRLVKAWTVHKEVLAQGIVPAGTTTAHTGKDKE